MHLEEQSRDATPDQYLRQVSVFERDAHGCLGQERLKQHPAGLRSVSVQVETHKPGVLISPFPLHGRRGVFQHDLVTIQTDAGALVAELEHPRDSYEGHLRVTPWSELQFLYFAADMIWNYLTLPFLARRTRRLLRGGRNTPKRQ